MDNNFKFNPLFVFNKLQGYLPEIDNEKLVKEILLHQKRKIDNPIVTMYEDMELLISDGSEGKKLIDRMTEIGESIGFCMADFWQHTHHPFESSDIHYHYDNARDLEMSWCYYVKAPKDCGDLVFIIDDKDTRVPFSSITPKEGEFIVFPSFLRHKVCKNMSNDFRISIAGDYIPFGKRGAYK